MNIVLATLDGGPAIASLLRTAASMAEVADARVEAVHAFTSTPATDVSDGAAAFNVALRLERGEVEPTLLRAIDAPEVVLAVMGLGTAPADDGAAGATALRLIAAARKPIVLVPHSCPGLARLTRILVPLEDSLDKTRPVATALDALLGKGVEPVAVHVFTESSAPTMLDRPSRDLELLGSEFLERHLPGASRLEWRQGPAGSRIADLCRSGAADLVVLVWSQNMAAGHALVVKSVLRLTEIPVLLLPMPA